VKRRRGNPATKLIVMAAVLLLSLSLMGAGYAMWSDQIFVEGEIQMGEWNAGLEPGVCGTLQVSTVDEDTLSVYLASPSPETSYTGCFYIENNGTVPVKIQDITFNLISGSLAYYGSDAAMGDSIYKGESKLYNLYAETDSAETQPDIAFEITIETVLYTNYQ